MLFRIMRQEVDEAGNVGFVEDETVDGDVESVESYLAQLNADEGYEHVAEAENFDGTILVVRAK